MFDIDKLSPAAKAEAMRVGNTAIVNYEQLEDLMKDLYPYLQKGEHFAVVPLGDIAGKVGVYSIKIIPVLKAKLVQ